MKVYHYTDQNGLEGIMRNGMIKESKQGVRDAFYGSGVYFTTMPPSTPTFEIILNNWDDARGAGAEKKYEQRTEYALEFDVPVNKLEEKGQNKDVWVYRGDFPIHNYPFRLYRRTI